MVLKARYITLVILMMLMSACGIVVRKGVSRPAIVPASVPQEKSSTALDASVVSKPSVTISDKAKSDKKISDEQKTVETRENQDHLDAPLSQPTTAPGNLMATLLDKAQKAIALQQWLRAQRALEQALRVEPDNLEIFLLYGDVYQGMGLSENAQQMYQRAIYLSGDDERVTERIRERD